MTITEKVIMKKKLYQSYNIITLPYASYLLNEIQHFPKICVFRNIFAFKKHLLGKKSCFNIICKSFILRFMGKNYILVNNWVMLGNFWQISRIFSCRTQDCIIYIYIYIYTEKNYKRNTFVFAPFFMSWTQISKTFSMYTKGLFLKYCSQICLNLC